MMLGLEVHAVAKWNDPSNCCYYSCFLRLFRIAFLLDLSQYLDYTNKLTRGFSRLLYFGFVFMRYYLPSYI